MTDYDLKSAQTCDILAKSVYEKLLKKGMKIATAESCTGGMLASALTDIAGVSECYGFGFVTYANEAKEKLLGVGSTTLDKYGAVSEQTASEMAQGALNAANADIALSVTGIAGPDGGTDEKPVGLVYIGFATKENTTAYKNVFSGDRRTVRIQTVNTALEIADRYLD